MTHHHNPYLPIFALLLVAAVAAFVLAAITS